MRTKSRIFTITLFIRFGFLLSKLVKSKPEAIKETDKRLRFTNLRSHAAKSDFSDTLGTLSEIVLKKRKEGEICLKYQTT